MPWPALPFAESRGLTGDRLRAKYGVTSFPSLVFVDAATGRLITAQARDAVARDPLGHGFPHAPPLQVAAGFIRGAYAALVPPAARAALARRAQALFPNARRA